jgi:serine/threonine protein kinase
MQDPMDRMWGRFRIIEERGRGGMAVVYKAYDSVLQRTVALKVLLSHLASDEEFTHRFRREAITAANLRHPNIVVIYDVGSYDENQFIVMEYLTGPTLQHRIEQEGALITARIMTILVQLASALDYAHQQDLVHRDVKPANIIIGASDQVTLTDFGLVKAAKAAKRTEEGTTLGTLRYMSPEQAVGKDLDRRSDVYSLAVVVYEMLTGVVPFTADTPYQALQQLIHQPPPPLSQFKPEVSPRVEQVVLKALAKEPGGRFATAGGFARALGAVTGTGAAVDRTLTTDSVRREIVLQLVAPDGREYPVYRGNATIGRDTRNDIVIPAHQVSRNHAQIQCNQEGCKVVDVGSTNGTFVNGVRIPPDTPWLLRPDDTLEIGPIKLLAMPPSPSGLRVGDSTLTMEI